MTVKTPLTMVAALLAVLVCSATPALAAGVPGIEGESVTGVTQTAASFSATVNPEMQPVTACEFRFSGGISAVACDPSAGELGEGEEGVGTGASLEGLTPNTEYHYKVLTKNGTGEAEVAGEPFLTLPKPPVVSTGGHSVTSPTTATVSGSVDPNALGHEAQDDTAYYIEYGGTSTYGKQTPAAGAGQAESPATETVSLEGLEPGTTYHYRVVASNLNDAGELNANQESVYGGHLKPQVVYGTDETFTTPATPPVLSEVAVRGVSQSGAMITATLNPQDLPTRYELQLGSTPGLLQPVASGTTSTTIPLSLTVGSLSPGTVYYYKLLAVNPNNPINPETNQPEPTETQEGSFTTTPAPAGSAPASLPALIPYQSIAELNAKEAKEDKALPNPTITKSLTRAQKLSKALKTCRSKKGKKRSSCEVAARKEYGVAKKKGKKQ
jgi:hypothetical protein